MSIPSPAAGGKDLSALKGLKVLSLSHVVAGPFAASLLADFGADVVHVEDPVKGDSARHLGFEKDGVYVWWKVAGRNKRSVTIDLRKPEGAELARELAAWADVVICSIRPSTLERWGLDYESLRAVNPRIVMLQITGFGMTGPKRDEPGFGKVGEAMSGVVNITGRPEEPLHSAFSHGDSVTGLMGAFGIMTAMYRRENDPDFKGELIDLALFEPLYRLIEWQVIAWDQLKMAPARSGNRLGFAPAAVANVYQSADKVWITVTSATVSSVLNVVRLIGLPDAEFQTVKQQRAQSARIDHTLREWIAGHTADEALEHMRKAGVVASRIFGIQDIMTDPVYAAREDIITVEDRELGPIRMQGVIPKMLSHAGSVWRSGPSLGEDNELVFGEWLRLSPARMKRLRDGAVI